MSVSAFVGEGAEGGVSRHCVHLADVGGGMSSDADMLSSSLLLKLIANTSPLDFRYPNVITNNVIQIM